MNIAYFGSPEISATLLKELTTKLSNDKISLVVTQPDRPVGKRLEICPTAVKKMAQAYKLPVFDKNLKDSQNELIGLLDKYHIDLCITYAYGEIIREDLLRKPKRGFWNVHPSLLPLYRGPSPAAFTIINGDKTTGVSLITLASKIDAGPIIAQVETQMKPHEVRNQLEERLTLIGVDLLIKTLTDLHKNTEIKLKPQNESDASYTKLLKKQDGYISLKILNKAYKNEKINYVDYPNILKEYMSKQTELKLSTLEAGEIVYNLYRGLTPWPGIWTLIHTKNGEKRLQICSLDYVNDKLTIRTVKLEGKQETDFTTFNQSYNIL